MEKKETAKLLQKYLDGKCTEREKVLIEAWYQQFHEDEPDLTSKHTERIKRELFIALPGNETTFIRFGISLIAACLAMAIFLTVAYKFVNRGHEVKKQLARIIPPGKNAAILTLSNGRKINLSTAKTGNIILASGSTIIKTNNGQIVYSPRTDTKSAEQNTITTPAGGEWKMQLPDGTHVWINASTSLTFPSKFTGLQSRHVVLSGEAYFEVAKDKSHPFIVTTAHADIRVLGTHFNVNAYPDEPSQRTTLAEGKVLISDHRGNNNELAPGQQAITLEKKTEILTADLESALAWTSGTFYFNEETTASAMRQLSRWYQVEFIVDPAIADKKLFGKISRTKNLDQVLRALEATKLFHCKMEGRRIFVMK